MKKARSFLDLMPVEAREKAVAKAKKRLERQASANTPITPEIYVAAEFGYHFGWDAMLAVRRGYTVEPVSGEKEILTLEEVQILLEGAKKVWYSKLIEQGHATLVATNSSNGKNPGQSFNTGIKPFEDRAKVTE